MEISRSFHVIPCTSLSPVRFTLKIRYFAKCYGTVVSCDYEIRKYHWKRWNSAKQLAVYKPIAFSFCREHIAIQGNSKLVLYRNPDHFHFKWDCSHCSTLSFVSRVWRLGIKLWIIWNPVHWVTMISMERNKMTVKFSLVNSKTKHYFIRFFLGNGQCDCIDRTRPGCVLTHI